MSTNVDIRTLLEAGVHFGHKPSRWHPKMAPYIHSERAGVHIIDLTTTVAALEEALPVVEDVVAHGKQVLFVGTKQQAADIVEKAALDAGMPFVNKRWFGGTLTNYQTISGRVKHLKKLEERMESGELASRYNKLEVQRFQEEIDMLNSDFGGIKDMHAKPGIVFVTDVITNELAVREATRLGVPVLGLVDTNADPSNIDYAIPANDDAIKGIQVLVDYVVAAVNAGKAGAAKVKAKAEAAEKKSAAKESTSDQQATKDKAAQKDE